MSNVLEGTAGIARALKALAKRKRLNKLRVKQGKPAIVGNKKIPVAKFKRKFVNEIYDSRPRKRKKKVLTEMADTNVDTKLETGGAAGGLSSRQRVKKKKKSGVLQFGEPKSVSTVKDGSMESIAVIHGKSINDSTLKNFLDLKLSEYESLDDGDEFYSVDILMKIPLSSLESVTLTKLADLMEAGVVTVRTMKSMGPSGIKSMAGGLKGRWIPGKRSKPDRVSTSLSPDDKMTKAMKGKGDVGRNPSMSPIGGERADMTKFGRGKGDVGMNPKGSPMKPNSSMSVKARKGKGDLGTNESDTSKLITNIASRTRREVIPLEDVDKGYPNAERAPSALGPNVSKGMRHRSVGNAGARDAGLRMSGTGPSMTIAKGKTKSTITASLDSKGKNHPF